MGHHKSNLCAVRYAIHKASLCSMLRDCDIPPKSRCIPFIHDPRSCWYVARGRGVGVWWYQGKIKVPNRRNRRTFSIFSILKRNSEYWKMKHTRVEYGCMGWCIKLVKYKDEAGCNLWCSRYQSTEAEPSLCCTEKLLLPDRFHRQETPWNATRKKVWYLSRRAICIGLKLGILRFHIQQKNFFLCTH